MPHFTPIERCILNLLSDGMPHTREEVQSCLYDEQGDIPNIYSHIHRIKKKLPLGQAIICENQSRKTYYRHVRLLLPPSHE